MKLLQIVFSGLGGHSSVAFSLIDADLEKKYTHVIIFYGIEEISEAYKKKCTEMEIDYFFIKKEPGIDIKSNMRVIAILKKVKPQIILLHALSILLPVFYFCSIQKARLISVEHQSNELKTKKDWLLSILIMLLSKKIIYLTDIYREQVKKKLRFIFRSPKVSVINNGINTRVFRPLTEVNKIGNLQNKNIGMLSRFTENKDHLVLLEAFHILISKNSGCFQLKLLLAGDGVTKARLLKRVAELNLQESVIFCGVLGEEESALFLNSIDLYVHASLGETMSTAILQAMACKKPIIASDVMGINNMLVNQQTGILVDAGNSAALAEAIWQLLNDEDLALKLGKNAYDFACDHYSNRLMLQRYSLIFNG